MTQLARPRPGPPDPPDPGDPAATKVLSAVVLARTPLSVRSPAWSGSVRWQPLQDGCGDLFPAAVDGQGVTAVLKLLQLGHGS
jgi:hypothetical protein